MSDSIDEAFEKYLNPEAEREVVGKVTCPKCGSVDVDRHSGYRGEYECMSCGYSWQVGGWQAT